MNKKDYKFICLWAKYLLTSDYMQIETDLKLLAEKGQISAMEKWYEFNCFGCNHTIDKNIQNISKELPQYSLILANIEKNKHKSLYEIVISKYKEILNETNNITIHQCILKKSYMEKFENSCDKLEAFSNKLKRTKYYKLLTMANAYALNEYKKTGSIADLSIYLDILQQQYYVTNDAQIKREINRQNKKIIKKIQQELPVVNKETFLLYKYILSKVYIQSKNTYKRAEAEQVLSVFADNCKNSTIDNHHQFE